MSAQTQRLAVMVAVLVAIAIGFHVLTGSFLTAENLYNIAQQTAVVGIVASGMALIIVARQIDLAVGSLLGAVGVLMAWLQYTQGWSVVASLFAGLGLALLVGLFQGWLSAVIGIPSFVVTLGGLVSLRGVAFLIADGKTQPITEPWLLALGGGLDGSLGERGSWMLGVVLVALLVGWQLVQRRAQLRAGGVPADVKHELLKAGLAALAVFGTVAVFNAYRLEGQEQGQGLPLPLVIWVAVVLLLGFIAKHTRFGRYVYAIGGNPDAARLAGIPVRRVMIQLNLLLAALVALAAIVAMARLNAGTNSMGTGMELTVIAAAVIGGVSLAGGSGSVGGTVLGALIIQSIDSGLLLTDVAIGWRMVVLGQVLVAAVVFDRVVQK
ncbi:D-xylose transport system permease protein [Pelomonas saccharophila]|uniref:D-xylose transport system permease protein n=1 Tax=Roseateles saccharophilus TaxID=304 RepID=A0ABU1YSS6_ROSSA|nr:ABC transporter permease [Roseateles saccharophilus]MDR7271897.1 D-xylose transport system permease protein [Roseateles saccharophilus]